jgi:PAS domain-containing protein
MDAEWLLGFGLVLTSTITALIGVLLVHFLPARSGRLPSAMGFGQTDEAVFLFDGENLIDSSPSARAIFASSTSRSPVWQQLMSFLNARFPDVNAALLRLAREGTVTLASDPAQGDPILMIAELRGGLTRIALHDLDADHALIQHDPISYRAQTEELAMLRGMINTVPVLIWRQNKAGEVFWANPTYLAAVTKTTDDPKEISWPLPLLFEATASLRPEAGQRQKVQRADGRPSWYDLVTFADGEGRICFGLPADAAVQAETSLRDFMQTLTKTFAQLQAGLAIFDSNRKLQLFNPALLDLTSLPIDFLSSRPTLSAVLDGMRDRNMLPEPKDYRNWRRQMIDIEKAAASGLYEETWSLPSGQTYRVIGRPHPNGALALILEDISSEMLRTRRFKADLELGQAVLDGLNESIAVFSAEGQMVMTNSAYTALWQHDPSETLSEATVATLCRYWAEQSAASQFWARVETFLTNPGDRLKWRADVRMADGRMIDCDLTPLQGGATLIRFNQLVPGILGSGILAVGRTGPAPAEEEEPAPAQSLRA